MRKGHGGHNTARKYQIPLKIAFHILVLIRMIIILKVLLGSFKNDLCVYLHVHVNIHGIGMGVPQHKHKGLKTATFTWWVLLYVGSGAQTQVIVLGQYTPLPTEPSLQAINGFSVTWPYLSQFYKSLSI